MFSFLTIDASSVRDDGKAALLTGFLAAYASRLAPLPGGEDAASLLFRVADGRAAAVLAVNAAGPVGGAVFGLYGGSVELESLCRKGGRPQAGLGRRLLDASFGLLSPAPAVIWAALDESPGLGGAMDARRRLEAFRAMGFREAVRPWPAFTPAGIRRGTGKVLMALPRIPVGTPEVRSFAASRLAACGCDVRLAGELALGITKNLPVGNKK